MNIALPSENIKRAFEIYLAHHPLTDDVPVQSTPHFELLLNSILGLTDPFTHEHHKFLDHLDDFGDDIMGAIISLLEAVREERLWMRMVRGLVKQIEVLRPEQGLIVIIMEPIK